MTLGPTISGEHKTLMGLEILHALVVTIVVVAATAIYFVQPAQLPSDLLGFVYGGAITYAGGRAAQSRQVFLRREDIRDTNE